MSTLQIHSQASAVSSIDGSKPHNTAQSRRSSSQVKKHLKNAAFVFIKPHASKQEKVKSLVKSKLLESKGHMKILFEFTLTGEQIERQQLIDRHYHLVSKRALYDLPKDLKVNEAKFLKTFQETWSSALMNDRVFSAKQVTQTLKCDAIELQLAWEEADSIKKVIKIAEGCYCGLLHIKTQAVYVINGFYLSLRMKYMAHDATIHAYLIEWYADKLSWKNFRLFVVGDYEPERAMQGTIRRIVNDNYQAYGLTMRPNKYDNIVHASASPFEALFEKCNWIGRKIIDDDFGKALLFAGITDAEIKEWFLNPSVPIENGGRNASVFQILKDLDANDCLTRAVEICDDELAELDDSGNCACSIM